MAPKFTTNIHENSPFLSIRIVGQFKYLLQRFNFFFLMKVIILKKEYLRAKLRKKGEFDKEKIPTYFLHRYQNSRTKKDVTLNASC